jgi:phosphatidylserine decarboxylase
MTGRSWAVARGYFFPPLLLGLVLLVLNRRAGFTIIGAAAAVLLFFRDPERPLVPESGTVYAAADGLIRDVDELAEDRMPGGRAVRVGTFLSLHNVHVNRSPVAGTVSGTREEPGGFAPALFGAAEENHGNHVTLDSERGPVVVVQKAGAIARRISCWVAPGEQVKAGQRIGLIHFGSRTEVLLPAGEVEVLVRPGDRVRAGITPIARYRSSH